jgi:hypothetical protein
MSVHRTKTRLSVWAGLWAAASLWAINIEAGLILATPDCIRQLSGSTLMSAVFTVLSLLAALVSWRMGRASPIGFGSPRTVRFDAMLSSLGALILAFALALQTMASLVLTGCER